MKTPVAILLLAAALPGAFAQTNAPARRVLSLDACIDEALRHNLDIQIERFDPELSRYNLALAYSPYDPTFSLGGTHNHNDNSTNSATDANSFNTGLGGTLPYGTTYNLGANISDEYVPRPEFSSGNVGLTLTQPLLKNFWINAPRENILVAKNSLKRSEQQLSLLIITSLTAVEKAY